MIALLPIVSLILAWGATCLKKPHEITPKGWLRDSLIRSLILWGAFIVLSSELLSALDFLSREVLTTAWGTIAGGLGVVTVALLLRGRRLPRIGWRHDASRNGAAIQLLQLALLVLYTGILISALLAPPSGGDALSYHMGRVAHWSQNQSIAHYATADSRQIFMSPWTELTVLHLYELGRGDRLANLVGWLSLAMAAAVASRIAEMLGAHTRGQLLAALFVSTIPMAIDQASNVMTDLPVAFWLLATVWAAMVASDGGLGRGGWVWLGLAIGIGVLTKGTYLPYAVPFLLWFAWHTLRHRGFRLALASVMGMGVLASVIAAPHYLRNLSSFGSALGDPEHLIGLRNLSPPVAIVSNALRSASMLMTTPYRPANVLIEKAVFWAHIHLLGFQPSEPAVTLPGTVYGLGWSWPGTNSAPVHLVLAVVAAIAVVRRASRRVRKATEGLLLGPVIGFLLFGSLFRWQASARFHIALLVLLAPVVGYVLDESMKGAWRWVAAVALLAWTAPGWFSSLDRGLGTLSSIPWDAGMGKRTLLYFGGDAELAMAYQDIADRAIGTGCTQVGLFEDSGDQEYLWWLVLSPAENGIRIEHLNLNPYLEPLADPAFTPCAIICTVCGEDVAQLRDLPRRAARDGILLFLRP